jgi:hypothetical protein
MQHVQGTRNLCKILEGKYKGKILFGEFGVEWIITQWVVQFVLVLSCGLQSELTYKWKCTVKCFTECHDLHYLRCSRSN